MPSTQYEVGQHFEELYTDPKTNQQYDSKGNPVVYPTQRYSPDAICYYTSTGQPLRYDAVYPGPVNVHQNVPLSDFAIGLEDDTSRLFGPVVAPVKTVQKRSDTFYKIGIEDRFREQQTNRAVGAVANEIQQNFDTDTYEVTNHALRDFLPDEVADNADEVLELQQEIVRFLTFVNEYAFDRRLISNVFTTSNFSDATVTSAGGGKWSTSTSANAYIQNAINSARINIVRANAMMEPTHVIMSADVAQTAAATEEIKELVKRPSGDAVLTAFSPETYGLPRNLFGVQPVVVPHIDNTAKKGQTASYSDLLTDNLIFLHVGAPARRTRNAVTTFRKGGIQVRTYRDEPREGTWIECQMIQDEQITNEGGGYVLTDAL